MVELVDFEAPSNQNDSMTMFCSSLPSPRRHKAEEGAISLGCDVQQVFTDGSREQWGGFWRLGERCEN